MVCTEFDEWYLQILYHLSYKVSSLLCTLDAEMCSMQIDDGKSKLELCR